MHVSLQFLLKAAEAAGAVYLLPTPLDRAWKGLSVPCGDLSAENYFTALKRNGLDAFGRNWKVTTSLKHASVRVKLLARCFHTKGRP